MTADQEAALRAELREIGEGPFRQKWAVTESHRANHDPDLVIARQIIAELDRTQAGDVGEEGIRWAIVAAVIAVGVFILGA